MVVEGISELMNARRRSCHQSCFCLYHMLVQRLLFIHLFNVLIYPVFFQMSLFHGSVQKTYGFWADIWFTFHLKKL